MKGDEHRIVVVTGLPRSGTSMVMRMLAAGGFPVLVDGIRSPDDDNRDGYFEYEPVKRIASDYDWLDVANGHAVKVVVPLLMCLPTDRAYNVLFICRNLEAVARSQSRMIARRAGGEHNSRGWIPRLDRLEKEGLLWCAAAPSCSLLQLSYEETIKAPEHTCHQITKLLGRSLGVDAMQAVVRSG